MKEQFTPGPWEISKSPIRTTEKVGMTGKMFKSIKTKYGLGGDIIANAYSRMGLLNSEKETETLANSNLIAAAPDMYEALEVLISVLDQLINNPAHESVMTKAKAALSKANPQI